MGVGKGAIREFGSLERRAPRTRSDDATNSWKNCLPRQRDPKLDDQFRPGTQILEAIPGPAFIDYWQATRALPTTPIGPLEGFASTTMGGTDIGSPITVQASCTIPPAGKHQVCKIVRFSTRYVLLLPGSVRGHSTRFAWGWDCKKDTTIQLHSI